MEEFKKRLKSLNEAQLRAVNHIEGPLMVVAGPGTGKTELLSVRVANILDKTDALPGNILCLTFTDSAAANMRERLAGLIGPDAYKVAVHTFHSFGSEVINQHGEYFYQGAQFRPADDLSRYKIITELLEKLPHDNPLSSKFNDKFTYLGDIQTAISELKRGGFTPDELTNILEKNNAFITWLKPKLLDVFGTRLSKKTILALPKLIEEITDYSEEALELPGYHPLHELIASSLKHALKEAEQDDSTKPITAWRNTYLEKDAYANPTLKDEKRGQKLVALGELYYNYLVAMQSAELYDFDDMILRVVHALETFDELRFTLQEQYQYILVDEFQDTNDAQMRLVWNLTNNPSSNGEPNLMIVGDDDQAIYRFQGAELSNILDFRSRYNNVAVVALSDNYRSIAPILDMARAVITQAEQRLEHTLDVSKTLTPHHEAAGAVSGNSYETPVESYASLAKQVSKSASRSPRNTRAVIARHHRELVELLPHLLSAGVTVQYERENNVLDAEPVRLLEETAHVLWHLSREEFDDANVHLSELLAHPAWEASAKEIWEISLAAHREHKFWLEIMLEKSDHLKNIAEWFIVGSTHARAQTLEFMLDYIIGIGETDEFHSPYSNYFFGAEKELSVTYLAHLSALQKIRAGVRDYKPGTALMLPDFIEYLDLHRDLGIGISASSSTHDATAQVTLLTAHKAKGLEFDTVFVCDVNETVWGSSARSRSRLLSFPSNLPLSPAGDSNDERLRLLFVALTRARNELVLSASRQTDAGKSLLPVGALTNVLEFNEHPAFDVEQATKSLETAWNSDLLTIDNTDKQALLRPLLEIYRLSATHLNNFLDITKGGPEYFLLHNLLRLPEAMSPSAAYGSAIHGTLQRAHQHLAATGKRKPTEDILHDFTTLLQQTQLSEQDYEKYAARGAKNLTTFFEQRYDSFTKNQIVERNFAGDHVTLGDAAINGALDLLDIDHDEKTIFVTDYKTGKPTPSWKGRDEYEKIKLHHYEQQLMIYKLLIEHSRQFAGYTVTGARLEFVEPDPKGEIVLLEYVYSAEKLMVFEKLIKAVWTRIQELDFANTQQFDKNFSGILDFEKSLLT